MWHNCTNIKRSFFEQIETDSELYRFDNVQIEPVSDIDTVMVDSLKALDPECRLEKRTLRIDLRKKGTRPRRRSFQSRVFNLAALAAC